MEEPQGLLLRDRYYDGLSRQGGHWKQRQVERCGQHAVWKGKWTLTTEARAWGGDYPGMG